MYNDNDKKEYSIVGKVEIGTDEYRDLIEAKMNLERECSEYRSEKWKLSDEKNRLNRITVNQKKQLDNYAEFLKEKDLSNEFDLWVYKKELEEKARESEGDE